MTKIDLGESCVPCSVDAPKAPEKYYPTLHINRNEPLKLPSEGTMTVTFKRKSETINTDEEGNEKYSCCIEIREIESVNGAEVEDDDLPKNRGKSTEDALDVLVAAHKASKAKEDY